MFIKLFGITLLSHITSLRNGNSYTNNNVDPKIFCEALDALNTCILTFKRSCIISYNKIISNVVSY